MPVRKVQGGYRWGNSGKVYPTKAQAERQGRAIYASGYQDGGIIDVTQGDDPSMTDRTRNFMGATMTDRFGLPVTTQIEEQESPVTPARLAWFLSQLRPSAGITDLLEMEPGLPSAEAGVGEFMSSEPMPGMASNIREGRYLDALLQGVGAAGDVAYATAPFTGPIGIGGGATMKGIAALGRWAKAGRTARDVELLGDVVPNRLNISPDTSLSSEMAGIQKRFAEQLNSDIDTALADYARLPDTDGGRILSTDTARELSADYRGNRALSAAVHEPASAFIKERYARLLSEEAPEGMDNSVLFTAGGTGSGKTTALQNVPEVLEKQVRAQVVYDTNLAGFESSVQKIDEALDAGKQVVIAYVHRDPTEALTGGAIPRAIRQEIQIGTGRTVPATAHARTHAGAANTIKRLDVHYGDNPNVDIRIIDNTRGRGNAVEAKLESGEPDLSIIDDFDYNELLEEVLDEVEKVYAEGGISSEIYRGFIEGSARG